MCGLRERSRPWRRGAVLGRVTGNEQARPLSGPCPSILNWWRCTLGGLDPEHLRDLRGRSNIRIDIAPDLSLVMADRGRVVQVIWVCAFRDGVCLEISVADEGKEIPTEWLPHLFHKFSCREGDDPAIDTDLGLAAYKGIVEAHGGRIGSETCRPELVARFVFTLPDVEEVPVAMAGWTRAQRK